MWCTAVSLVRNTKRMVVTTVLISTVMCRIMMFRSTTDCIYDGFLEALDKLIVEENYLPEQIFNMDETSLFWKWMPERTFIHKEAKLVPGFKVFVSTLYDIHTKMILPNDAFLRMCPCC